MMPQLRNLTGKIVCALWVGVASCLLPVNYSDTSQSRASKSLYVEEGRQRFILSSSLKRRS